MKLLVFYRLNSDHTRAVEEYLHDLKKQHDIKETDIKLMDCTTRDAVATASLYDIVSFPGFVVTSDVGEYVMGWSGSTPLMSEIMSYYHASQ